MARGPTLRPRIRCAECSLRGSLLAQSGLRQARQGFGIAPTWPVALPLLWIPIDHCLVSPHVVVDDFRVGTSIGSDHYPVIVDLRLPAATSASRPGAE